MIPKTVRQLFLQGRRLLKRTPLPTLEAKVLLLRATSLDEKTFYANPDARLSTREEERYLRLLRRRLSGTPLSYLAGEKEFWSLSFKVGPGVLVPRPETELLVEKVLEISNRGAESILDMGTGSGNIAVALAKELPKARLTAADISPRALRIAVMNASRHGCSGIQFVRSDLFSAFGRGRRRFDIIVSNPPYVGRGDWARLPAEIRDNEPKRALLGGAKGLEFIDRLVRQSLPFLRPGGHLVFEIGAGQAKAALSLFGDGWDNLETCCDLSSRPRVIAGAKCRRG